MPRHKFQPTDEQRRKVKSMAGFCVKESRIALIMGVSSTTLRKHFREELMGGPGHAKLKVLKRLFDMATSGRNPAATMFCLKTRGGWSENGNPPESTKRDERHVWVIREYQPPASPEHKKAFEEAVELLRASGPQTPPEWEGDKGGEQGEDW
jgi:hypothetical protein